MGDQRVDGNRDPIVPARLYTGKSGSRKDYMLYVAYFTRIKDGKELVAHISDCGAVSHFSLSDRPGFETSDLVPLTNPRAFTINVALMGSRTRPLLKQFAEEVGRAKVA